jgi:hypothetical protein
MASSFLKIPLLFLWDVEIADSYLMRNISSVIKLTTALWYVDKSLGNYGGSKGIHNSHCYVTVPPTDSKVAMTLKQHKCVSVLPV